MLRGIKVKLYPNREQKLELNKVLGCYRFVYNQTLSFKQQRYKDSKESLGVSELCKYFHNVLLKRETNAWLKEQNTKVMQQAIRQMLVAYEMFFKSHKGFPKYKSKKDKQSALFPLQAISKMNTFENTKITLTQPLKNIKFKCSDVYLKRLQLYKNNIKSATLTKTKSGRYFLSILIDIPQKEIQKFRQTGKYVGIDLGVKDFVITSDGEVFDNKHFLKRQEKRINKLQRELSRKHKGSNNWNKQRIKLAKKFEHQSNQRRAYLHYVINELLNSYDVICMEDLNVHGMLKNHKISKAIQELGLSEFKQILIDKANVNNKQVVSVSRYYPSSKKCHKCGYINRELVLNDREWDCPVCGEHHNRDLNAAINILNEGQRIIGSCTA